MIPGLIGQDKMTICVCESRIKSFIGHVIKYIKSIKYKWLFDVLRSCCLICSFSKSNKVIYGFWIFERTYDSTHEKTLKLFPKVSLLSPQFSKLLMAKAADRTCLQRHTSSLNKTFKSHPAHHHEKWFCCPWRKKLCGLTKKKETPRQMYCKETNKVNRKESSSELEAALRLHRQPLWSKKKEKETHAGVTQAK